MLGLEQHWPKIQPDRRNFNKIGTNIRTWSCDKMRLKMHSAKCRSFCPDLNMLIMTWLVWIFTVVLSSTGDLQGTKASLFVQRYVIASYQRSGGYWHTDTEWCVYMIKLVRHWFGAKPLITRTHIGLINTVNRTPRSNLWWNINRSLKFSFKTMHLKMSFKVVGGRFVSTSLC